MLYSVAICASFLIRHLSLGKAHLIRLCGLSSREPKSLNIIAVQGRNLIATFSCIAKQRELLLGYRYCLVVSASLAGENSGVAAENGLFTPTPNTRQTNS